MSTGMSRATCKPCAPTQPKARLHDNFMWGFLAGERHTREILALTYGLISCFDDQIGRILARLKANWASMMKR